MTCFLQINLLSDTCFSSGQGFAGEVDTDIEQEEEVGLPMIRGRTLKGLLLEECTLLLKVLSGDGWQSAANTLFGSPGQLESARLRINSAYLPNKLRKAVQEATSRPDNPLSASDILHSLTEIRYQTKIDRTSGAPQAHSLRSTRLALKGLVFYSRISLQEGIGIKEKALLAASALSVRRGGLNRNRGWGRLRLGILQNGQEVTRDWAEGLPRQEGGAA